MYNLILHRLPAAGGVLGQAHRRRWAGGAGGVLDYTVCRQGCHIHSGTYVTLTLTLTITLPLLILTVTVIRVTLTVLTLILGTVVNMAP